ncbi:MAG TPA: 6-phosphogluconolactonase [Pricia antarctica]|uniref:6-phosphogluconolactonase n=1 Tax=Pricia antarctica TaxID=641691 RepID=A0A831VSV5_9FLAO|nr:6-phosphogluconolactonase [Pricia antarctica]
MQIEVAATKQQTAVNFADWLIDRIHSNDTLHVALSGGSTPKIVFDELASRNLSVIKWRKVHLYWGDERCVSPEDSESNYKMTVEHLLSKIEIPEGNIHRVKGENDPSQEAQRYSEELRQYLPIVDGLPQFDVVILGMGDDGHTASIFPHEIELWNAEQLCAVAQHPETGQKRITITGKIINHAIVVAFLVTGESKAEKVGEIINERGGYKSYPAHLVHPSSENLMWFLDEPAAAEITTQS